MIWKLYYAKRGNHIHCRLFCGPQRGALGKCGDIVMRHQEFTEFTRVRRVLGIDFVRELEADGSLAGDSDGPIFDTYG